VRQNTPHPRELKAKAHKLFSKGQNSLEDSDLHSESVVEAVNPTVQRPQTPPPPPPTLAIPEVTEQVIGNGAEDNSEPSAEEETIDALKCREDDSDRMSGSTPPESERSASSQGKYVGGEVSLVGLAIRHFRVLFTLRGAPRRTRVSI
jgi:hypothetical protein